MFLVLYQMITFISYAYIYMKVAGKNIIQIGEYIMM